MEILRAYWGIIAFGIIVAGGLLGDHLFIQSVRSQLKTAFSKIDELRKKAETLEMENTRLRTTLEFFEKYLLKKP